jgi:hypothetical protein
LSNLVSKESHKWFTILHFILPEKRVRGKRCQRRKRAIEFYDLTEQICKRERVARAPKWKPWMAKSSWWTSIIQGTNRLQKY